MTPEQTQRVIARGAAKVRRIERGLNQMENVLAMARRGATVEDMKAAQRLVGKRRWTAMLDRKVGR